MSARKKDGRGRKPGVLAPGSVRWHLERLQPGESYTVSQRVDGDAGKAALAAAGRYVNGRVTSAAYRPTTVQGLRFELGDYRTNSGDFIVCMTASKIE